MEIINLRKGVTIAGILLIIGSVYLNLLGILEANTNDDQTILLAYIIPANIVNGLAVICLIILTINSTKLKLTYKILIVLLLLSGLVGEFYLLATQLYSKNYINYIVLVVNLLVRVYYLAYYFNESWAMFPGYYLTYVKDMEKVSYPKEAPKASESVSGDSPLDLKAEFRKILKQAKEKVGDDSDSGLNKTYQEALKEVINPAIENKEFTKEKLKEAAAMLKDKEGNSISGLTVGGKKRR